MVGFMTANEAAEKWQISHRRVITLCRENRIPGAGMLGNMWIIPTDAEKPSDKRTEKSEAGTSETEFEITIEETVDKTFRIKAKSINDAKNKGIAMYKNQQIILEPGDLTARAISIYDTARKIQTDYEEF